MIPFLIILYICFISVWASPSGWRSCHTVFWGRQAVGGVAIRIFGPAKQLAELPYAFLCSAKRFAGCHTDFWAPPSGLPVAIRIFGLRQVVCGAAIRIFGLAKWFAGLPYGLEAPGEHFPEFVAHLAPT